MRVPAALVIVVPQHLQAPFRIGGKQHRGHQGRAVVAAHLGELDIVHPVGLGEPQVAGILREGPAAGDQVGLLRRFGRRRRLGGRPRLVRIGTSAAAAAWRPPFLVWRARQAPPDCRRCRYRLPLEPVSVSAWPPPSVWPAGGGHDLGRHDLLVIAQLRLLQSGRRARACLRQGAGRQHRQAPGRQHHTKPIVHRTLRICLKAMPTPQPMLTLTRFRHNLQPAHRGRGGCDRTARHRDRIFAPSGAESRSARPPRNRASGAALGHCLAKTGGFAMRPIGTTPLGTRHLGTRHFGAIALGLALASGAARPGPNGRQPPDHQRAGRDRGHPGTRRDGGHPAHPFARAGRERLCAPAGGLRAGRHRDGRAGICRARRSGA